MQLKDVFFEDRTAEEEERFWLLLASVLKKAREAEKKAEKEEAGNECHLCAPVP